MRNGVANKGDSSKARIVLKAFYAVPVLFALGVLGFLAWSKLSHRAPAVHHISTRPFGSVPIDGLTVNLFTQGDHLRASGNDLFIEFRDPQGTLADVGEATLLLELKMPDMVMHSIGKVFRTATPGQYRTSLDPQMAGDWVATIGFSGPRGTFQTNFTATVK